MPFKEGHHLLKIDFYLSYCRPAYILALPLFNLSVPVLFLLLFLVEFAVLTQFFHTIYFFTFTEEVLILELSHREGFFHHLIALGSRLNFGWKSELLVFSTIPNPTTLPTTLVISFSLKPMRTIHLTFVSKFKTLLFQK